MINDVWIVFRQDKGCQPLSTEWWFGIEGSWQNTFSVTGCQVSPAEGSVKSGRLDQVGIAGIDSVITSFAARCVVKGVCRNPVSSSGEVYDTAIAAVILY